MARGDDSSTKAADRLPATLGALLDDARSRFGPRPALLARPRYRTEVWTYDQLWQHAANITGWLDGQGVRPGDRVLIWGTNCPAWAAALFGIVRLGAVVVPIDFRSDPSFVRRVIAQTEPKLVLIGVAVAATAPDLGVPTAAVEDLPRLAGAAARPAPTVTVAETDLAEIVFTSGTTGDPKGVMLTHRNICSNVESARQVFASPPEFRLLSVLPLSHMFEQTVGLYLPMRCGASIVYPLSRQSTTLMRELQTQGITTVLLVPQALQLLMDAIERGVRERGLARQWPKLQAIAAHLPIPARRRLFWPVHRRLGGKLQFLVTGGAAVEPSLLRRWELLGVPVQQGYGITEASPVISGTRVGDPNRRSVGTAAPGVEIKLASDGEILVRGPNVTAGYWRNPAATAATIEAGWLKTGDLGRLDDDGHLYLRGRKKDMIVLANGLNVYPEDVEQTLRAVPGVADAAVVGLPAEAGGQVHAVLLPPAGGADPADLVKAANRQLAPHQQIRSWSIWPASDFPRTHTLKVRKAEVLAGVMRERQGGQTGAANVPPPALAVIDAPPLHRLIGEAAKVDPAAIRPEAALGADLGLDSLGRVELLAAIEATLGVYLDDGAVGPATTVAELARLVGEHGGQRPDFPTWPVTWWATALRGLLQGLLLPLLAMVAPARVSGEEQLAGVEPPVLFVANHASHLDTPVLLRALPAGWRRRTAVAAAADYFFSRRDVGFAAALILGAFPFSRTTAVRPTLEHCAWLFDHRWSILMYPEGTRSTTGELGEFRTGVGLLAVELGVPVVPLRTEGTYRSLPKGRWLPRPGPVRVWFGAPLRFPAGTPYPAATQAVEAAVRGLGGDETRLAAAVPAPQGD